MTKEPMTQYGYEKLVKELKHLKETERPEIVKEIDVARSHGDLKENAEYHAAKEKQAFIEVRIHELGNILAMAHVIDPAALPHARVSFGSTIKVMDVETEIEHSYTIVGAVESDPHRGYVSYHSPLAKALIGKEEGDIVVAQMPNGTRELEVLEVGYKEISFETESVE